MNNKQIYRHGELLLVPCDLPKNTKTIKETKEYIVAHSETGHHHVLESKTKFQVIEAEDGRYLVLPTESNLVHRKTGKDVHKTHKVVPDTYKVVIKREFDYFAGIIRQVRD